MENGHWAEQGRRADWSGLERSGAKDEVDELSEQFLDERRHQALGDMGNSHSCVLLFLFFYLLCISGRSFFAPE
jgi:hypothetical protein